MGDRVKLSRLEAHLVGLEYPVARETVVEKHGDTTLQLADGEATLGSVVDRSETAEFRSARDLTTEVLNFLPRRAVGEPFQSEGEG
jgi:hypothetical protein